MILLKRCSLCQSREQSVLIISLMEYQANLRLVGDYYVY